MVFKSRKELNGELDPAINNLGRPKDARKPTKREMKDRELSMLVRKLKPHLAESVNVVSGMLRGDKVSDTNKLKASALIMTEYQKIIKEIYSNDAQEVEDIVEEVEEERDAAPVLSLKIVNDD